MKLFWMAFLCTLAATSCDDRDFPNPSPSITPPVTAADHMLGWEYQLYTIDAPSHEKDGPNALASNELPIKTAELNLLGTAGWELTASWLESETSFPEIQDRYLTYRWTTVGNVRPMRVVLLFKRPLGWKK